MSTFYDRAYVTCSFDADVRCIIQVWHGYASSAEFRDTTLSVIEFVSANKLLYPHIQFFCDTRLLGPMVKGDMEWAATVADPQLHAHGMRKIAFVVPASALGRTTLKSYQKAATELTKSPLDSKLFTSTSAALDWLKLK